MLKMLVTGIAVIALVEAIIFLSVLIWVFIRDNL